MRPFSEGHVDRAQRDRVEGKVLPQLRAVHVSSTEMTPRKSVKQLVFRIWLSPRHIDRHRVSIEEFLVRMLVANLRYER
jgi:hypothetical protein